MKLPCFAAFDELVRGGLDMVNAYKLANFDELTDRRSRAAAQAAVDDARGLSHLAGVPGGDAAGGGLSDEELRVWQGMGFTPEKARAYHSRFTKA